MSGGELRRYLVDSGGMTRVVMALDHEAACAEAVRLENEEDEPASLGLIMQVIEVVEDDVSLCATENVCRAAGCWREP